MHDGRKAFDYRCVYLELQSNFGFLTHRWSAIESCRCLWWRTDSKAAVEIGLFYDVVSPWMETLLNVDPYFHVGYDDDGDNA